MKYKNYYPRIILAIFLLVCTCIGYLTARDYGLSWDELGIYQYSEEMLRAYNQILHPWNFESQVSDPLLNLYGPSHFMLSTLFSRYLNEINKSWSLYEAHHLFYFLTFLIGMPALYFLCARWMSEWVALCTVILFSTQPLFWGNAFINPKDIPFMIFFIISVYFGFIMVDSKSNSTWWKIIIAGIALGLTASIRSLGFIAGSFALFYGLRKDFHKTLKIIPTYFFTATIFMYLSWPYLWGAPVSRFIESITTMSQHPLVFSILFMGKLYPGDQTPFIYSPTFIVLQLTIQILFLIFIGFFVSSKNIDKEDYKEPIILLVTWFLIPSVVIGLSSSTLYDNARQLLFLIPPLFIIGGGWVRSNIKPNKNPFTSISIVPHIDFTRCLCDYATSSISIHLLQ